MAAAFGDEGELEGALTGVAAVAVLVTEWKDAEEFEVKGYKFALSSAVGADRLKVVVTHAPATDFKFEKQFGCDDLKQAGFGWMPFDNCVEVIRKALEGDDSITVALTANGGDGVDVIIVVSMGFLHAEYRLSLERLPLLLSDKLSSHLRTAKKDAAALRSELEKAKASLREATSDGDAAKQQMAEAMAKFAAAQKEIESLKSALAEMKSAMAKAASDSGAIIEELKEAVVNAKAAAKRKSAFIFDIATKGGYTQPRKWRVSADGKCATAKRNLAQMMISPPLRSDSKLTIQLLKKRGLVSIGVTDDYNQWFEQSGCEFYSDGGVKANGFSLAKSQAFGDWHSGDRLFVTANLSSGTVSIRAPNGEYTAEWTPSSSPIWFAVFSGDDGTEFRLI